MNCTYCGRSISDNTVFCEFCGEATNTENNTGGHPSSISNETLISGVSEEHLSLFVGKQANSYLQKWSNNSRWNWPAFLLDAYWLLYRKMYLYFFLFLAINVVIANVFGWLFIKFSHSETLATVLFLLIYGFIKLLLGINANRLYLHQAKRKINRITGIPYEQLSITRQIKRDGGTSVLIPVVILVLPLLIVFLCGLIYGIKVYQHASHTLEKVSKSSSATFPANSYPIEYQTSAPSDEWTDTGRINILLLGDDSTGRTDSMIVLSIDPTTKSINLFSILQRTYMKIPGHGTAYVSNAFQTGGASLAMRTVEELMGIPIEYYVHVDYQGFINMIDDVGGLEFYVENDMDYIDTHNPGYDIHLKQGNQHLDGAKVLQYARFRGQGSDIRTERQQSILTAFADKLTKVSTVANLPDLLDDISRHVETNLSFDEMLMLGKMGFNIDINNIESSPLPSAELIETTGILKGGILFAKDYLPQIHEYVSNQLE